VSWVQCVATQHGSSLWEHQRLLQRFFSTKGPESLHLWFLSCFLQSTAEKLRGETEKLKKSQASKF